MVKDPNYTKFKGTVDDLARQNLLFLTNKRVKQHRKKKVSNPWEFEVVIAELIKTNSPSQSFNLEITHSRSSCSNDSPRGTLSENTLFYHL